MAHLPFFICRGVARGGLRGLEPPGIWQISKPYSNQRGQIMPLTLLPAPSDSKSYERKKYIM